MSPDERRVLREFARNYLMGRRFVCWSFRVVCAVGAIASALVAIGMALRDVLPNGIFFHIP